MLKQSLFLIVFVFVIGCESDKKSQSNKNIQIAFLADVHFQDVYGGFSDTDYNGVLNPETGKHVLARTMQSQLKSTRLFNENYFAFLSALDDIVKRGVKYVVLPGDFSDDGQALNVRGLKEILKKYEEKHKIQFIITTGNHDPVRPFYQDAGKKDFLGEGGKNQPIYSKKEAFKSKDPNFLETVVTKDIAKLGYEEILLELKDFGFRPKPSDMYWETPFSDYKYENYSFEKAGKFSLIENRSYSIAPYNSKVPDLSYLVERNNDLWFLAIDGNVYIPKKSKNETSNDSIEYGGASIGFNNVITHKKYLFDWIKTVTERAEKLNKTLIVFSHYPVLDFNDGASENIKFLLGEKKMQLHRVPNAEVEEMFKNAGVKIHFGGHMHINDTGISEGLINIQIPSLAAYIPAYKLLTISGNEWDIETMVIDNVSRFKELFPLYEMEYDYLKKSGVSSIWNNEILNVNSYKDFTEWHLKELVRLRFLKADWPEDFKNFFLNKSANDLMKETIGKKSKENFKYANWKGADMLFDLYRLRSADELAFEDIGIERMKEYNTFVNQYKEFYKMEKTPSVLAIKLFHFCEIFQKFSHGEPSNHFKIEIDSLKLISTKKDN